MPSSESYEGGCHCGAIHWLFTTGADPAQWVVRACQCSFCRMHATRCTSDPEGSVEIRVSHADALGRYRFGLATADFLVCTRCGVYLGAVVEAAGRAYATINLNTMSTPIEHIPDAVAVHYDAERSGERVDRRVSKWTPVIWSK